MKNSKEILSIRLSLTKDGFEYTETKWLCVEKKEIYELTQIDEFNQKTVRKIKKDELFKPLLVSGGVIEISYTIKTFPHMKIDAKKILMEKVLNRMSDLKSNLDLLSMHI